MGRDSKYCNKKTIKIEDLRAETFRKAKEEHKGKVMK